MAPNGEPEIRVVDETGRPVADAAVSVQEVNERGSVEQPMTTLGRRRGSFGAQVAPGRYRVQVEPPKRGRGITYHGFTEDVLLEHAQAQKTVEAVLRASRAYLVSGRVLLPDPERAERMMVALRPVEHGLPEVARSARIGAPLDKWGRFVVHGVAPGVYELRLSWLDDAVSTKDSESYLLREVTVADDVKGLLLAAPAVSE
jgi:hypothetical protein